ncbi:hypothetical protein DIC66_04595 [Rhodoferax lacus]|uniref:Acyltransferase 3 domain-containing protein n=1 Tax=Rhodoferax lacus TaxID=2184758 RepID=A0A3E1RF62_9BURK|nr:hypothetical protein DIC66_04595 [Rhodoferax lacus]
MSALVTISSYRLSLVDTSRCFAATWVVLFHMSEGGHIASLLSTLPALLSSAIFEAGHLGVPIFFVLSGIVMKATTFQIQMIPCNAFSFVGRRLVRLAPPYYVAIAFGIFTIMAKHMNGQTEVTIPDGKAVAAHLFFLQSFFGMGQILSVF